MGREGCRLAASSRHSQLDHPCQLRRELALQGVGVCSQAELLAGLEDPCHASVAVDGLGDEDLGTDGLHVDISGDPESNKKGPRPLPVSTPGTCCGGAGGRLFANHVCTAASDSSRCIASVGASAGPAAPPPGHSPKIAAAAPTAPGGRANPPGTSASLQPGRVEDPTAAASASPWLARLLGRKSE